MVLAGPDEPVYCVFKRVRLALADARLHSLKGDK